MITRHLMRVLLLVCTASIEQGDNETALGRRSCTHRKFIGIRSSESHSLA